MKSRMKIRKVGRRLDAGIASRSTSGETKQDEEPGPGKGMENEKIDRPGRDRIRGMDCEKVSGIRVHPLRSSPTIMGKDKENVRGERIVNERGSGTCIFQAGD